MFPTAIFAHIMRRSERFSERRVRWPLTQCARHASSRAPWWCLVLFRTLVSGCPGDVNFLDCEWEYLSEAFRHLPAAKSNALREFVMVFKLLFATSASRITKRIAPTSASSFLFIGGSCTRKDCQSGQLRQLLPRTFVVPE